MTTIAYDGRTVAADSRIVCGGYTNPLHVAKLHLEAGILFATSGLAGMLKPCVRWFLNDERGPDDMPKVVSGDGYSFIVFRAHEPATYFHSTVPHPVYLGSPDAWGSGADFAIGAMLAHRTAQEAVQIACIANSAHSAPPVISYTAEGGRWVRNEDLHTTEWWKR